MTTSSIYAPIADDLPLVEQNLQAVAEVEFSFLAGVLRHILLTGGKRVRPALTLLAGKFYRYDETTVLAMATGVELLHTATLVHDDIVDNAITRRGVATINRRWSSATAVLLGDYIFAKAADFVARTGDLRVIRMFARTLMTICDGELRQLSNAALQTVNRESYYDRIFAKTASLFQTAAASGAILSDAPEEAIDALAEYGRLLGIAFQVVDDILDFMGDEREVGKPVGADLQQGNVTLPALLLMERYPEDNPVRRIFRGEDRDRQVQRAIEMIRNSDIIDRSYETAAELCQDARRSLDSLPGGDAKRSLVELTEFVLERRK